MHPTTDRLRVELIVASVRPGRFGGVVADWVKARLDEHAGFDVNVLDLADFDLPPGLDGTGDTQRLRERVADADAFVLVTPEYNHGYPGYLKIAIDTLREEWHAKPLGFVSYGGGGGGARSVEQLRPVFNELQVVPIREQVVLTRVGDLFDGAVLRYPEGPQSALKSMLDQLLWWGRTLQAARITRSA